eukprot:scaffold1393_cov343-Prasinococcus_capsulatus_cf.AAC.8
MGQHPQRSRERRGSWGRGAALGAEQDLEGAFEAIEVVAPELRGGGCVAGVRESLHRGRPLVHAAGAIPVIASLLTLAVRFGAVDACASAFDVAADERAGAGGTLRGGRRGAGPALEEPVEVERRAAHHDGHLAAPQDVVGGRPAFPPVRRGGVVAAPAKG